MDVSRHTEELRPQSQNRAIIKNTPMPAGVYSGPMLSKVPQVSKIISPWSKRKKGAQKLLLRLPCYLFTYRLTSLKPELNKIFSPLLARLRTAPQKFPITSGLELDTLSWKLPNPRLQLRSSHFVF